MSWAPGSRFNTIITPWKITEDKNGSWEPLIGPGGDVWWKTNFKILCYSPFKDKLAKVMQTDFLGGQKIVCKVGATLYVFRVIKMKATTVVVCGQRYRTMYNTWIINMTTLYLLQWRLKLRTMYISYIPTSVTFSNLRMYCKVICICWCQKQLVEILNFYKLNVVMLHINYRASSMRFVNSVFFFLNQ